MCLSGHIVVLPEIGAHVMAYTGLPSSNGRTLPKVKLM